MSLLQQICAWSKKELAPWQRDALRRLFQSATDALTPSDYDDLCALLKAEHGIADEQSRSAHPLEPIHIPGTAGAGDQITLYAMRELAYVNRIAEHQTLHFAPDGLTVIYGGNGSGKSGYSRVLKKVCRARDGGEEIQADLRDPAAATRVPSALLDVKINGAPKTFPWKQTDAQPPDCLSQIAVFDSHCARSYLDDEQDVAFMPYGLGALECLGRDVMPRVSATLTQQMDAIQYDVSVFSDLLGATRVGQWLKAADETHSISELKSSLAKATALGTLVATEPERLVVLRGLLAEQDPLAKAKAVRLTGQRFQDLADRMTDRLKAMADNAIEAIKKLDIETQVAIAAARQAAKGFRAGEELLPGTGETVWRQLFEAAQRYSTDTAYVGKPFPHVHDGSVCVLCQQPMTPEANQRLERFRAFIHQDATQQAKAKGEQLRVATQQFLNRNLDFVIDAALTTELETLAPGLLATIQASQESVEKRKKWCAEQLSTHDWGQLPALVQNASSLLAARIASQAEEASQLEASADPAARAKLQAEEADLASRTQLAARLGSVKNLVERKMLKLMLRECVDSIKTKAVSDKVKAFASEQVTETLRAALSEEFLALGVGAIKTRLKERAQRGSTKHKLVLDYPGGGDVTKVLSEGEQRSIAIGSFLAELKIAGHSGGIVFDDPVSSLDHHRRRQVAERLVKEAKNRQVIVFTHDTVFLGELRELAEQEAVPSLIQNLEWLDGPGHVNEGLPWEHLGYKEKMHNLAGTARVLAKSWPAYPNAQETAQMRSTYSLLRATVERVVEDVLLNGVIGRYRGYIKAGQIDGVADLTAHECSEVRRIYQLCHGVVDAHDTPSAQMAAVPDASRLTKDIDDLQAVITSINTRRNAKKSKTI